MALTQVLKLLIPLLITADSADDADLVQVALHKSPTEELVQEVVQAAEERVRAGEDRSFIATEAAHAAADAVEQLDAMDAKSAEETVDDEIATAKEVIARLMDKDRSATLLKAEHTQQTTITGDYGLIVTLTVDNPTQCQEHCTCVAGTNRSCDGQVGFHKTCRESVVGTGTSKTNAKSCAVATDRPPCAFYVYTGGVGSQGTCKLFAAGWQHNVNEAGTNACVCPPEDRWEVGKPACKKLTCGGGGDPVGTVCAVPGAIETFPDCGSYKQSLMALSPSHCEAESDHGIPTDCGTDIVGATFNLTSGGGTQRAMGWCSANDTLGCPSGYCNTTTSTCACVPYWCGDNSYCDIDDGECKACGACEGMTQQQCGKCFGSPGCGWSAEAPASCTAIQACKKNNTAAQTEDCMCNKHFPKDFQTAYENTIGNQRNDCLTGEFCLMNGTKSEEACVDAFDDEGHELNGCPTALD